jgi:hypothetical protein
MMQLAEIMRRNKMQQGQNLLGLAQPGQTIADILTPDMARRVLGKNYNPSQVIKPETIDTASDKLGVQFLKTVKDNPAALDAAQPGDVLSIGATIVANQKMGVAGPTTPTALKSQAQAAQSKAAASAVSSASVLDLVKQGTESFKNAAPKTRAAMGQKLAFGQSEQNLVSEELNAQLQAEVTKEGIKFAADPNTHPWGKQLRQLKIDPTAALAAAGTGMLSLMGQIGQMAVDEAQGKIQMSVARANRETAMLEAMSRVDNDWADRMSQAVGGKLPPSVILQVMRTPREKVPKENLAAYDAAAGLINQASASAYKVLIADAYRKGNPAVAGIESLFNVAKGVKDTKVAEALGGEIRRQVGELTAIQLLGPRPEPTQGVNPQDLARAQAAWDNAVQKYSELAPKQPGMLESFFNSFKQQRQQAIAGPQNQTQGIPNSAIPQQPLGAFNAPAAKPDTPPATTGQSIKDLTPDEQAAIQAFFGAMQQP